MTREQTYSIKDMLSRMDADNKEQRSLMNDKIDNVLTEVREFRDESRAADVKQDERIKSIEVWRGFIMGAIWLLSGSGALTGLFFLVKNYMK